MILINNILMDLSINKTVCIYHPLQGTEFSGARKADLRERQRLVQLVQLQAQEIDALKDEITLLSRKGGHILPPAQPPLPPGHTPIPNQL